MIHMVGRIHSAIEMDAARITDGIYWVGAIDWDLRDFHGYKTPRGSSYNSYLITGEKNILIDTVKRPLLDQLVSRISSVIDPKDIDIIISNHVEKDHSSSLPEMQDLTGAKVMASKMGVKGLSMYYPGLRVEEVRDDQEIDLGTKTLKFIDTPMLHWPDSMFTYVEQDSLLFSMDAFGQHFASSKRFDDEVEHDILIREAEEYYANILMPFGARVLRAFEKIKDLNLKYLATSHGLIWRSHINEIVDKYISWAKNVTKEKVLIVYDTMWGSTRVMADAIAEGIAAEGVEVHVWRMSETERSLVMHELLDSRAIILGTPTLNNGVFPTMADITTYIKGLRPVDRLGAIFGSYGWSGGGVQAIRTLLQGSSIHLPFPDLQVQYLPQAADIAKCRDWGRSIAQRVKNSMELSEEKSSP